MGPVMVLALRMSGTRRERESQCEVVRQAWTKLEPRQAHIIHRWYVEGWSADEIAAETRLEVMPRLVYES